jgi:hypothetical protein
LLNRVMCSVISAEVEEERQALIVFRIFRFSRFLSTIYICMSSCVCGHCGKLQVLFIYDCREFYWWFFFLQEHAYDRSSSSDINNSMNFLIASFFCMRILRNSNCNANRQHKYAKLQIGWARFLWLQHEFLYSFRLNLFTVLKNFFARFCPANLYFLHF